MATTTDSLNGPRLWLHALYTVPQIDPATVDPISRWLILGRVSVVVMSAISAVIGGLLAARDDVFDWPLMILVAAGLILAHTGSNLVNDFWDYRHGLDTEDSPRVNYGPHPLATKGTGFREFVLVTIAMLAAATGIGVYLTVESGPEVLIFALTGAALLMFYSGGPFPLKYIGLGEIAVFFIWGPLMIGGTYYVLAEELPGWVLLASVPYGLGVTSVLFGKHLDKLDFDSSKGIRTAPIVLGQKLARYATIVISVAMYATVGALAVWQEMWALAIVVAALPMLWQLIKFFNTPKPDEPPEWYRGGWPLWFVGMAFIHNRRFGMLFIGGLALQLIGEAAF
ncbi:MAG: prenyltransferase [Chloroflexi bacterium]|nr:prenyltransferase [Chloroflexota bacterium]